MKKTATIVLVLVAVLLMMRLTDALLAGGFVKSGVVVTCIATVLAAYAVLREGEL